MHDFLKNRSRIPGQGWIHKDRETPTCQACLLNAQDHPGRSRSPHPCPGMETEAQRTGGPVQGHAAEQQTLRVLKAGPLTYNACSLW